MRVRWDERALSAKCDLNQLLVSAQGAIGALGHVGLTMQVDNPTAKTCEVNGYPKLRLLDGDDQAIGPIIEGRGYLTGTRAPPRLVPIPPGDHAVFIIEWNSAGNDGAACRDGVRLGVTLPGATRELLLPASSAQGLAIAPCGGGPAVSPVLPTGFHEEGA
jgi:hypothetical protein